MHIPPVASLFLYRMSAKDFVSFSSFFVDDDDGGQNETCKVLADRHMVDLAVFP
jgi:hypothetical protein